MTRVIKDGSTIEYEWDGSETEWEKEAIREYGVEQSGEIEDALAWREAIDEMDNEQAAWVMRGKHPTNDKNIGRAKPQKGRGNGQS